MSKKIENYTELPHFERKQFPSFIKSFDDIQGIVEHIVAVMGNVDDGNDRIKNGAFVKTISEHGLRVKCLDQHGTDSVTRIVGKPISMREIGRDELPSDLLQKFPTATGGLLISTKYALDTTRGRDVYNLVKGGYAPETSVGYDTLDQEFVKEIDPSTGKDRTIRDLKTMRLWEYSNVVFGMNEATTTLSAKEKTPSEAKPYQAVEEDGKWRVYKLDAEGKPTGEALGEHETEEEAQAQVRALYVAMSEEGKPKKEMTPQGPVQRLSHILQGTIHRAFTALCDDWYTSGLLNTDERIMLSGLIGNALGVLEQGIPEEIAMREPYRGMGGMGMMLMSIGGASEGKAGRVLAARNAARIQDAVKLLHEALTDAGLMEPPDAENTEDTEEDTASEDGADNGQPKKSWAGPEQPPPTQQDDLLRLIEIEQAKIRLLEV